MLDCLIGYGTRFAPPGSNHSRRRNEVIETRTYPKPPFPDQKQSTPGLEADMNPKPDYGEQSYVGSGKLTGEKSADHRGR